MLDVSRSMEGQPLADLKIAAKAFIANVIDSSNPDVRVSIVPFSHYVNVGIHNRNASWMDVPDDYTSSWENCTSTEAQYLAAGCYEEDYTCTWTESDSDEEHSATCQRWQCPDWDMLEQTCTTESMDFTFNGCVNSRTPPYDVEDTRWDIDVEGAMSEGVPSWWCPAPIQPLTNSQSVLDGAIDSLAATDWTYIAPGLAWGLRTLSPGIPFDEALADIDFANQGGRRVIVLMSDGANTRSADSGGWPNVEDGAPADVRTLAACDEIKANDIDIYVIGFNLSDAATIAMLTSCASTADQYYPANSGADLIADFAEIGPALGELRLTN